MSALIVKAKFETISKSRETTDGLQASAEGGPSFLAVIGSWSFVVSMAAGLSAGALLLPLGGDEFIGAIIAFGALCIAAAAAHQALAAQAKVEELQQRLQDEASYHAFVDAAIEGFFRTTRDGRYLIVNPALAKIYGYDTPDQLRTELTDIASSLYVDPKRREEFHSIMVADRMVHDFVSQIRRRDGSVIWIAENARMVTDGDNQFLFYEGTVEDITIQRESEEAIRQALRETQEAAHAKAAFLAAMSHELKTPLNAVIGFSDLMRQELFGPIAEPRYRSYITDIYDNGRHLLALIDDILDLSRFEGRLIDLDDQAVCVADIAASARAAVLQGGKSKVESIDTDIPLDLPSLKADPRRLQQILVHLLSNAAKFTPKDGRVRICAARDSDGGIGIQVQDSGIGMDPDRIRQALEPFKQLDNRLARRFDGAGIGLPLASALCSLHGARLTIQSEPGKGTIVTAHFPPERTVNEVWAGCA